MLKIRRCRYKILDMYKNSYWNRKKSIQFYEDAVVAELKKMPTKAIDLYQQSIKFWPENLNALYNLGLALATEGEVEQSIRVWKRLVWLKPSFKTEISNILLLPENESSEIILFDDFTYSKAA